MKRQLIITRDRGPLETSYNIVLLEDGRFVVCWDSVSFDEVEQIVAGKHPSQTGNYGRDADA